MHFTRHARDKFAILRSHGVIITPEEVIEDVQHPDLVDYSRSPLTIAQRVLTATHVLRVVYREERGTIVIITFYPGRKSQYEKR